MFVGWLVVCGLLLVVIRYVLFLLKGLLFLFDNWLGLFFVGNVLYLLGYEFVFRGLFYIVIVGLVVYFYCL